MSENENPGAVQNATPQQQPQQTAPQEQPKKPALPAARTYKNGREAAKGDDILFPNAQGLTETGEVIGIESDGITVKQESTAQKIRAGIAVHVEDQDEGLEESED